MDTKSCVSWEFECLVDPQDHSPEARRWDLLSSGTQIQSSRLTFSFPLQKTYELKLCPVSAERFVVVARVTVGQPVHIVLWLGKYALYHSCTAASTLTFSLSRKKTSCEWFPYIYLYFCLEDNCIDLWFLYLLESSPDLGSATVLSAHLLASFLERRRRQIDKESRFYYYGSYSKPWSNYQWSSRCIIWFLYRRGSASLASVPIHDGPFFDCHH